MSDHPTVMSRQIGSLTGKPPRVFGESRACDACGTTLRRTNPDTTCDPCQRKHRETNGART